jgi:hypothetical protein
MKHAFKTLGVFAVALAAACTGDQRDTVDSAAGTAIDVARTELSVLNVDMGKHVDAEKKVPDGTDVFAKTDTIFASVHTSGTAKQGQLSAKWIFPDSSVVDQKADSSIADGTQRHVFFITKPGGLPVGKYTFRVIVDGREVRDKDVTVQ